MISFLIPYRDRQHHLKYLPDNISSHYDNYEILIGEQDDDLPFKRGQLLNVLVDLAQFETLVLMDVDCRIIERIDFEHLLATHGLPVIPWYYRQETEELSSNEFKILIGERYANGGFGGISCWTKDQYLSSGGASNLCSGWAAEDSIMFLRTEYKRLKDDLYHIKHRSKPLEFSTNNSKKQLVKHNRRIWKLTQRHNIDPQQDGIYQTITDICQVDTTIPNCKHFKISNITVPDTFKYPELLPRG